MCGIVGYIGSRDVPELLLDGLKRLEYRGYDSCGIAVLDNGTPKVVRSVGRIEGLEAKLRGSLALHAPPNGNGVEVKCGIGHTRWATHGRPSEVNAHPHCDCTGHFLVAHNGIIENYTVLKRRLAGEGHRFCTETDTEVLPHLIESHFRGNLEEAVRSALQEVEGVYGLVAITTRDTMKIVAARRGAPLVVGMGRGENFIASDAPALLPYTAEMLYLDDGEVAVIRRDSVELRNAAGAAVSRPGQVLDWSVERAEKNGYPHFMLKEIFEQPRALRDTFCGRLTARDDVNLADELDAPEAGTIERVKLVACGTSFYASMAGKYMIEELAQIPVETDLASEFRYRNPRLDLQTMVVAVSQSGETADTLAALREGRGKEAYLLAICNVVGSQAAREADDVLYTRAGPEIGVASTKAFTTQLAALYMLGLYLARLHGRLSWEEMQRRVAALKRVPQQLERVLERSAEIAALAERLCRYPNFLYLGRGVQYPIALEGALKLKEISYIHAEGYAAGEMKHGPIALIDSGMPVVVVAPRDPVFRKTMGNIEEVRVRGGIVVAVATEGDEEIREKADHVLWIPDADPLLAPLLAVAPLQLLAYHIAVLRGCDVDKPRNLAKSVTVE